MAIVPVQDIDDPRLAIYRDLPQKNLTRQSGLFIAEGEKVAERLIESAYPVVSILAEEEYAERYRARVDDATPIYVGSRSLLERVIGFNFHRGIVACGRRQPGMAIGTLGERLAAGGEMQTIVACLDIHDPTNLGSIIRSAAALGCAAVVLGEGCADPFSRRVLRVSMGAALHLPIVECQSVRADLGALTEMGFELVATVLDPQAERLCSAGRGRRLCLLLGSEGHGLPAEIQSLASRRVTIPMQAGVDSLNVAVAAAVCLHHFCEQCSFQQQIKFG